MCWLNWLGEFVEVCHVQGCYAASPSTHPKGRLLHSPFLFALFKQNSEGPHFWFLQFASLWCNSLPLFQTKSWEDIYELQRVMLHQPGRTSFSGKAAQHGRPLQSPLVSLIKPKHNYMPIKQCYLLPGCQCRYGLKIYTTIFFMDYENH